MPKAIVIGAGPNGLVAANKLVDAGWSVDVFEAVAEPGGAVASEELIEPGFVNDVCSAFFPLAAASPAIRSLELERWGVRLRHAPLVLAHPSSDGRCVVLSRDLDETAASFDSFARGDGDAWRELYRLWRRAGGALLDAMTTPMPPVRAAARLARTPALCEPLLLSVRELARRRFAGAGATRLLAGNALHADLTPESAASGFFGWLLTALGQDVGFPCVEGGAGRLAQAMANRLEAGGGTLTCGARVERVLLRRGAVAGVRLANGTELPASVVLADVDAPSLYLRLVGREHLPSRIRFGLRRFRWDPATFKLDWTLDGPVQWNCAEVSRSAVVHLGADSVNELSAWAHGLDDARPPGLPFLVFGQYAVADQTRCPAGRDTAWAYTRVPQGLPWDEAAGAELAERIERRIEDYAPRFRKLVRGRHVLTPPQLEARNSNLVGGALNGGTARVRQQLVLRPVPGLGRPETPFAGLYLASASAHPGGGVHGAPGAIAARAALNAERARRTTLLLGTAAALAASRRP
jgi:phytoene dehydrogenase-like protein